MAESLTLADAYALFLKERKIKHCSKRQYRYGFKYLKALADLPLEQLTPEVVVAWFDDLNLRVGFALAHRTTREAKAVVAHVLKDFPNTTNPLDVLRQLNKLKQPELEEGIISGGMWAKWLVGVLDLGFDSGRDLVLFIWQTGTRVKEARLLKWKDVCLEDATFTLPDAITQQPITLPMSTFAVQILAARKPEDIDDEEYVFTGMKPGTPTCWTARGYSEMCARNGLPRHLSTIRKSVLNVMLEMQLPEVTIKYLLNRSSRNPAFYQHNPNDARVAVEQLSAQLLRLCQFSIAEPPPMVVKTPNKQPIYASVFPLDLCSASVSLSVANLENDKP